MRQLEEEIFPLFLFFTVLSRYDSSLTSIVRLEVRKGRGKSIAKACSRRLIEPYLIPTLPLDFVSYKSQYIANILTNSLGETFLVP